MNNPTVKLYLDSIIKCEFGLWTKSTCSSFFPLCSIVFASLFLPFTIAFFIGCNQNTRYVWRAREKRKRVAGGVAESISSFLSLLLFPFAFFSASFPSPILSLSRRLRTVTYGLFLKDVKCFKFPLKKTTEKIHQVVSFTCASCPLLLFAVATVCILLVWRFKQQRTSGSWAPAIKKKRENHLLLSDLFDG